MSKLTFVFFCLFLFSGVVRSQVTYFKKQNQLKTLLATSKADTGRVSILLKLGQNYLDKLITSKTERDSAWRFYLDAEKLSKQLNDEQGLRRCIKLKGNCLLVYGNFKKGRQLYLQLAAYYHNKKDYFNEAQTWSDLGNAWPVHYDDNRKARLIAFSKARKLFSAYGFKLQAALALKDIAESHMYADELNIPALQLLQVLDEFKVLNYPKTDYTYFLLSIINRFRSNIKMELYYALKAKAAMLATGDKSNAMNYYISLGDIYQDMQVYSESYYNYKLALENLDEGYSFKYKIVQKLIFVMIAQKKSRQALIFLDDFIQKNPPPNSFEKVEMYTALGACYEALGDDKKAEKAYIPMGKLTEMNHKIQPSNRGYIFYNQIICDFYLRKRNYIKASLFLIKLDTVSKAGVSPIVIGKIKLLNFKVDSAYGRLLPAIKEYQAYKKLNDSIFSAVKIKEANELVIKYKTVEKDKDLLIQAKDISLQKKNILLLTRQNQLSLLMVEKGSARQKFIAGCALFLVLLLGVGYWRYRDKQRINLQLREQKEEVTVKNRELEQLLDENQWLLREVHHRVKNNLQIVISLLNSQSAHLQDEVALNAVIESRMRVQSMSLIHQKLYGCENVSTIFLPDYIAELIIYLQESFKSARGIVIEQHIAPLSLDVSQAVPLGLILNEAITNAFKYAFPNSIEDTLIITLTHILPLKVTLIISDNGKGLPKYLDLNQIKSFGLKLIKGLTEDLDGSFSISGKSGTTIVINFDLNQMIHRNIQS